MTNARGNIRLVHCHPEDHEELLVIKKAMVSVFAVHVQVGKARASESMGRPLGICVSHLMPYVFVVLVFACLFACFLTSFCLRRIANMLFFFMRVECLIPSAVLFD